MPPSSLVALIDTNRDLIVERFVSESVRKDLPPAGIAHRLVVDHIPRFLDDLSRQVSRQASHEPATNVEATSTAREHGEQRWELGYDLEGLIREYGVLRHCILQVAKEHDVTPSVDEFNLLARLLNDGVAAASAEYIRFRDREGSAQKASLQFLSEAGQLLSSSLDYRTTLAKLASLLVPRMADWCAVHLEGVSAEHMPIRHVDPNKVETLREIYRRYPLPIDSDRGYPGVIRSGKPLYVAEVETDYFERTIAEPEQRRLVAEIHPRSWLIVPLSVQSHTFGAITLAFSDSRQRYTEEDLVFATELARRVAVALDNARLYDLSQLERSRAEAAGRAKDEFVAVLSHELRTPLNAILGWLELLSDPSLPDETRAHALTVIERNARGQRKIVDDLLDISSVMAGNIRIRPSQMDLSSVIELALEGLRAATEAKRLRVELELDRENSVLRGDSDRLQQVIANLLSNAVKFSTKDGSLTVRLRRVSSDLELTVTDSDEGIDAKLLPHVFEAFRQADSSFARPHGGLGVGLSITKHLVELHGGTIDARSEGRGKGATFVVRLPVAPVVSNTFGVARVPAMNVTSPTLRAANPAASGIRILIVDDDEDARDLLTHLFESCGMVVTSASSAREARDALDGFTPDVIVSDIGMPEEEGYAFIRSIRSASQVERRSIPAVALTAFARVEDRRRALLEGFNAHARKPVEPRDLVATVVELASPSAR